MIAGHGPAPPGRDGAGQGQARVHEGVLAEQEPADPRQVVRAMPGAGLNVPIWILGSSLFGAQLAAMLGLPFVFASHFAPNALMQALHLYRTEFQPSESLKEPYVMLGVNVIAADTDREAQHLFTSLQQQFIRLVRGTPGQLPPPVDRMDAIWSPAEQASLEQTLRYSVIGSPETVRQGLTKFIAQTQPNEIIATAQIFDHQARLHSFEIAAQVRNSLPDLQPNQRDVALV